MKDTMIGLGEAAATLLLIGLLLPSSGLGDPASSATSPAQVPPSAVTAESGSVPTSQGRSPSRGRAYQALLTMEARDLAGRTWTHERLRGRIVLVDFWATWCAPCIAELPYLKRARRIYGDDFLILGVSLDRLERPVLEDWLRSRGVDWPQIHQPGGFDGALPVAFDVERLPTNFLLDAEGRVRAVDVRRQQLFVEIERLRDEEPTP